MGTEKIVGHSSVKDLVRFICYTNFFLRFADCYIQLSSLIYDFQEILNLKRNKTVSLHIMNKVKNTFYSKL